ncbi:Clavaminate synthase-like protein [Setomelanomma holmii]|uniref:Clavaminate synthase-like protein n=1 Tax=Setomelanomma holmii TaxID=210430 RepID=A0A9P4H6V6_9PLEO|nr:Clavaminate synthase-like protein [Setomelanomma holmii]
MSGLDWADLPTLDLSLFDTPGGKEKLARQLFDAIDRIGFFYIINFGLSQEAVDRQFVMGKELFELPTEEKLKYRADLENGGYNGYKPIGLREIRPGVHDNTEIYNIPKFIPDFTRSHPEIINNHRDEIEQFARHISDDVVGKLLVLLAIILELPETFFLDKHRLTLLFRQPVAALQVRTPEGEWKHVKPYPGSITVNLADSLEFLTNGFLKSSIHRVVAPPPDQANIDRLGVLYFVRPEDDVVLKLIQSAVLKKLGYTKAKDEETVGITAGE